MKEIYKLMSAIEIRCLGSGEKYKILCLTEYSLTEIRYAIVVETQRKGKIK
jgi:hypothetical protein